MSGTAVLGTNLVDSLVTMVDELRGDLHADMGVRPFRVWFVRRLWSGSRVGDGAVSTTSEVELTPAPKVTLKDHHTLTPGGLQESGVTMLEEVSLTYTQAELLGEPLAANEEFFYRLDGNFGQGLSSRLYIPQDHPDPDREKTLGWKVLLRQVDLYPNVVA